MTQNVEALKKKYDDLNGSKTKNESATKSAQTAYEDANEELQKTKKYLEEYFATNNSEILEAQKKQVLHIDYSNFKNVGVKQFPASLKLKFMTDFAKSDKEMQISIDMNAVKTDSNWEAETKVSDKYKKVSPEDVLSKIMNM